MRSRAFRRSIMRALKKRVARYLEAGRNPSPREIGKLVSAPKWCTHPGCGNKRKLEGKSLAERRAEESGGVD